VELVWAVLNPVFVEVVPLLDPVSAMLVWDVLDPVLVDVVPLLDPVSVVLIWVELGPVLVVLVLVLVWDVLDPVSVVEVLGVVDTEVVEGCNVSDVVVGVVDVVEL